MPQLSKSLSAHHSEAFVASEDVFRQIQRSLVGDKACGIPEPKTSILGPFAGRVLKDIIPDLEVRCVALLLVL